MLTCTKKTWPDENWAEGSTPSVILPSYPLKRPFLSEIPAPLRDSSLKAAVARGEEVRGQRQEGRGELRVE